MKTAVEAVQDQLDVIKELEAQAARAVDTSNSTTWVHRLTEMQTAWEEFVVVLKKYGIVQEDQNE